MATKKMTEKERMARVEKKRGEETRARATKEARKKLDKYKGKEYSWFTVAQMVRDNEDVARIKGALKEIKDATPSQLKEIEKLMVERGYGETRTYPRKSVKTTSKEEMKKKGKIKNRKGTLEEYLEEK